MKKIILVLLSLSLSMAISISGPSVPINFAGTDILLTGTITANKVVGTTISGSALQVNCANDSGINIETSQSPKFLIKTTGTDKTSQIRLQTGIRSWGIYADASNDKFFIRNFDGAKNMITLRGNPMNVGIGVEAPSTELEVAGTISGSALQINGIASVNQLNLLFYDAPHAGLVGTKNIKIDTASPYETMTLTSEGTSGGWSGRINNALSNSGGSPYVASTLVNVSGVPRLGIGIGNTLPNTALEVNGTTSANYYIGTGGTTTPSAVEGAIWYNRTSKKLNYYNGTSWVSW